ncbi:MAG: glycosyltransferase family 4 protein [Acidobacteriota bacterium]
MRLVILSHTPHYRTDLGVAGWGPTVRELDHLATLWKRVVHMAPLAPDVEDAPPSSRTYRAANLRLRPLVPTGGDGLSAKLGILAHAPAMLAALADEITRADAVHVRAPANVAALAIAARPLLPTRPWWVKYAGNWRPAGETARREAASYRWQRRRLAVDRGWAVTVNGRFPGDGPHTRAFLNPSLDDDDLERGGRAAAAKILDGPPRLLFVGRLDNAKGAGRALEIAAGLPHVRLDMAGDGPQRGRFEALAERLGVKARFHGWLDRTALDGLYARAHFMLLPSLASEGWPKVLSEAMAWGVVPVASDISAIPSILADFGVGAAHPARDLDAFRAAIQRLGEPERFADQSRRATRAARNFSYRHYLEAVRRLFRERFDLPLPASPEV